MIFSSLLKRISISFFLCFFFQAIQPATIIFDLEGVLIKKSTLRVCWNIGFSQFIGRYNPFGIQKKLFEFLDLVEPRRPETPCSMHNNILMPQILCDWLTGTKTTVEIRERITTVLKEQGSIFTSPTQKKVVGASALFVFTPKLLAQVFDPIKKGKKLLKRCYLKKDKDGNRINKVYILSNWDPESFEFLSEKPAIKKLLAYTDGIMISGHVHLIKPDHEIFETCFLTFAVDPDQEVTIFIDDRKENIIAARQLEKKNLYALHCKKMHFKSIKKKLKQLKII